MKQCKNILIVDDDPYMVMMIEGFLGVLGYSSKSVNSGPEALAILKTGFDLVLLDVMLPGMNGFEVVRHIRENHSFSEIPVIMVTAIDDKEARVNAVQAGAADLIGKPFDIDQLLRKIRMIMDNKDCLESRPKT